MSPRGAATLLVVIGAACTVTWLWMRGSSATESADEPVVVHDESAPGVAAERPVTRERNVVDNAAPIAATHLKLRVLWSDDTPASGVRGVLWEQLRRRAVRRRLTDFRTSDSGEVRLRAVRPGEAGVKLDRSGGWHRFTIAADRENETELRVARGVRVHGHVEDAAGEPVKGAAVHVASGQTETDHFVVAETDASGRFSLRDVTPGRWIGAHASGHAPSELVQVPESADGSESMTLTLSGPGGAVTVKVVARDTGEPVVGAGVYEVRVSAGPKSRGMRAPPRCARTGSDGIARIEGVQPGTVGWTVQSNGFFTWYGHADVVVKRTTEVTAQVERCTTLAGRVTDVEGNPLARAQVWVNIRRNESKKVRSDAHGRFALDRLPGGKLVLHAKTRTRGSASKEVEVDLGARIVWNPIIDPGHVVRGRVLDAEGKAYPFLWVELVGTRRIGRTDTEGRFHFVQVEKRAYDLRLRTGRQMGMVLAALRGVFPGKHEQVYRLPVGARARGSIKGTIAGGDTLIRAMLMIEQLDHGDPPPAIAAHTARGGKFVCTPLPAGRYRLVLVQGGRRPRFPRGVVKRTRSVLGEFVLASGQKLDVGELKP